MQSFIRKAVFIGLTSLAFNMLFTSQLEASHWRGGYIYYEPGDNPNEVCVTIVSHYRAFSGITVGQPRSEFVSWGDGASGSLMGQVTFIDLAENFYTESVTGCHTYTGCGPYNVSWSSCCKINGMQNNSSDSWNLTVDVHPCKDNSSPITGLTPIVDLELADVTSAGGAQFTIPWIDPDCDNVGNCRLAANNSAADWGDSGSTNPPGLSVSSDCVVTFENAGAFNNALYNARICNSDGCSESCVDFIIRISNACPATNNDPILTMPVGAIRNDPCVDPDGGLFFCTATTAPNISFNIEATDTDAADNIHLSAAGVPTGAVLAFTDGNPASGTFSWTPTIPAQEGTYLMNILASDGCTTTIEPLTIIVGTRMMSSGSFIEEQPVDLDHCSSRPNGAFFCSHSISCSRINAWLSMGIQYR